MNEPLAWLLIAPAAYLIGSIPVGLIVCRMWGGVDPREHGSGSMGATNVLRTVGKKAAVCVFVLDFGKGVVMVGLSGLLAPTYEFLHAMTGTFVIVGHTWPIFAGFKGGKGISPGWGAILMLAPVCAAVTLVGLLVAVITRYVSLGSMIGASLGVGMLIVLSILDVPIAVMNAPIEYLAFAVPAMALILYSHRENMMRLQKGTENRLDINAAEGPSASGGRGA